jgi:hypothetical protein
VEEKWSRKFLRVMRQSARPLNCSEEQFAMLIDPLEARHPKLGPSFTARLVPF